MALQRKQSFSEAALQRGRSLTERLQRVPSCLQRSKSIKVEELSLTDWEVQGVQRCLADDFSHLCLEMHWRRLFGFVLGVYGAASVVFATLFYLTDCGVGLGGDVPPLMSNFEVCLWFATVNIVTAGFGSMVPMSTSAYVISTTAHLTGLLLNALLLGIVVAKASLPTAKMVFSNVICVRTRNKIQQLMVRVGNARGNILFSPDIRFAYIHSVTTEEGETYFEDLPLHVRVPAALKPVFTITHPVDQDSPLDGKSEADIIKERGFFLLIVSATDVETGQAIYARRMYFMKDFRFNHMFEDVISGRQDGTRTFLAGSADAVEGFIRQTKIVDFLKFHKTIPLKADCWREGTAVCEPSRRFGILAAEEPVSPLSQLSPRQPKPIGQYDMNGGSDSEYGSAGFFDAAEMLIGRKRDIGQDNGHGMRRSYSDIFPDLGGSLESFDFMDRLGKLSDIRSRARQVPFGQSPPKEASFDSWGISKPAIG